MEKLTDIPDLGSEAAARLEKIGALPVELRSENILSAYLLGLLSVTTDQIRTALAHEIRQEQPVAHLGEMALVA